MKTLSFEVIKEAWIKAGYPIEEMIRRKQVILTGIRMNNQFNDTFNDFLTVCYWDNGKYEFFGGMGTTDPGNYYLENPLNVKGTFVMKPGFYKNVWTVGKHRGYDALVQIGYFMGWRTLESKFPVIKDGKAYDSNGKELPLCSAGAECGINMHSTKEGFSLWKIGRWGAACQVWMLWKLFLRMMVAAKAQRDARMPYLSYALFTENDFL